ncbi:MAG: hypothetical protein IT214_05285 [Chitinophagaceae bacterium]|nr:hypothetical protein [Chitinophagaceae bacterium]
MKQIIRSTIFFLCLAAACSFSSQAQKISGTDLGKLQLKEDSLKFLAKSLITDSTVAGRMRSDSLFVRTLLRALEIKNSFYFPFDSVIGISKLYAPDTTFRIFTWSLSLDEDGYYYRQRGAIQFPAADGSLKLIPLRDYSEFTSNPMDSVRTKDNWIGAVYYNMIKTEYRGKKYYTLFGYDNNSAMSNKKWIEVLTFNDKKEPLFGGPYFTFDRDSIPKPPQYRFSIEYKKDASTLVNYINDLGMILVDHLVSETNEPENKWTYVPDGDNEGFKWINGKWVHVNKVFNQKLKDGQFPMDNPLYDKQGNPDEKKLKESTDKNKNKSKTRKKDNDNDNDNDDPQ